MIRVLLADDHPMVRAGLAELVGGEPDMEVVGAAGNGDEAVVLAGAAEPDVVLMDLSMPELDGVQATRRITAERDEARVVVLTSFADREMILDAVDAGAVGYLLKDAAPEEVLQGIRAAHRGESPLAPKVASAVLTRARTRQVELTEREQEVLGLIGSGLSNKVIALRLGITEQTVKTHATSIFQGIGVTNRTHAALWAQRHGYV